MLSDRHREIVRATVPVLQEHGETITKEFYSELFEAHPELLNMFNTANQRDGNQARSLAASILSYAAHIDHLDAVGGMVDRIAHKHASLQVLPEHYPVVGHHLLNAIRTVLGDAATGEIIEAWAAAYEQLAGIMIGREGQLYAESAGQAGGWSGYKPFKVQGKVRESSLITSFYLVPADGSSLPPFQPGQYLGVLFEAPDGERQQIRQYSLSCAPNSSYYRISVKREYGPAGNLMIRPGVASNYLHDRVKEGDILRVSMPFGDFVADETGAQPMVFITGGVGITPALSMLHHYAAKSVSRPLIFIHATQNGKEHAFRDEVNELTARHAHIRKVVFYDQPLAEDLRGEHFDYSGRLSIEALQSYLPDGPADFYYCGSLGFMCFVEGILDELNIPTERRHSEAFAPDPSFTQSAGSTK